MKRFLLSIMMLTGAIFMMAQDFKYLNVSTAGTTESITLESVLKITFTATDVVVHTSNGEKTFSLSDMEKMSFTASAVAIDMLPVQSENLQFVQGQIVTGEKGLLCIYNASGVLTQIAQINQEKAIVNLDNLPSGMYIVSLGKHSIKISK